MLNNLFPAILLAGPPHSGKSVLAFQLTKHLLTLRVSHYLLRAVPDGEGNWFLEGEARLARELRSKNKTDYSTHFLDHMRTVITSRLVPLLVDIGGRPQGTGQLGILGACTHAVLLYRTSEELEEWRHRLSCMNLQILAELRSNQEGIEEIDELHPVLRGSISGLEREASERKTGIVFGALLERIAGICFYDEGFLEMEHLRHAPYPVLHESRLAKELGIDRQHGRLVWQPAHLAHLMSFIPAHDAYAVYGRGPVWLVANLAVITLPDPLAIFDLRFGWITVPEPVGHNRGALEVQIKRTDLGNDWVDIHLPAGILDPDGLVLPSLPGKEGLIFSGPLPRWAYAALTRYYAPERLWLGIEDANMGRVVIVHSNSPSVVVGSSLDLKNF